MADKPICFYHWQRRQIEVPATRCVAGEFMCDDCFKGRELIPHGPPRDYFGKIIRQKYPKGVH